MLRVLFQFKYNIMLLISALIWGMGYTVQRDAAHLIEPFLFNAVRYLFAFFVYTLAILALQVSKKKPIKWSKLYTGKSKVSSNILIIGFLIGFLSFLGSIFQQTGLYYTTAGKAGFIIESAVVLIPLISFFMGKQLQICAILGSITVLIGLFFLSNGSLDGLNYGDALALMSAIVWAFQALLIERFSPGVSAVWLANLQFLICGVLSLICSILFEIITWASIEAAIIAILYSSIFGSIIAFTLQIRAQQKVSATQAGMFLSLAAMFSAISAWLFLDESMTQLAVIGCIIMTLGMILSQLSWWGSIRFKS